jgi:hypothetical protein
VHPADIGKSRFVPAGPRASLSAIDAIPGAMREQALVAGVVRERQPVARASASTWLPLRTRCDSDVLELEVIAMTVTGQYLRRGCGPQVLAHLDTLLCGRHDDCSAIRTQQCCEGPAHEDQSLAMRCSRLYASARRAREGPVAPRRCALFARCTVG